MNTTIQYNVNIKMIPQKLIKLKTEINLKTKIGLHLPSLFADSAFVGLLVL